MLSFWIEWIGLRVLRWKGCAAIADVLGATRSAEQCGWLDSSSYGIKVLAYLVVRTGF